ncbi:MAG: GIY-YIG nuclease family protein [Mycoplasma sp.]|nr:GIY-YIG nuclease family protein [Mycoplasma sp.]
MEKTKLQFSFQTKKHLKFYVYILTTVINNEETIFYVGKGKDSRVFSHFHEANKINIKKIDNISPSIKLETIKDNECNAYIVAAELTEEEAFKIESVLISVLYKFNNAKLTNLVGGHHNFEVTNVHNIEIKYAKPIELEKFVNKNNIKILAFKSTRESYNSAIDKDFRGILEGMWKINDTSLESVDYIIGVIESKIYGVYKLKQGSIVDMVNMDQKQLDKWNKKHIAMGRPARYKEELLDGKLDELIQRTVFELIPVAIPKVQKAYVPNNLTEQDKEVGNELLNRTINDKKISGRSSLNYFGKVYK